MTRPATAASIVLLAQDDQSYVRLATIDFPTRDECEATWRAMPTPAEGVLAAEGFCFFAWKCLGEQVPRLPCTQDVKRITTVEMLCHLNCLSVEEVLLRCRLASVADRALNKAMGLIVSTP